MTSVILGRSSNNLTAGIVGLANVGKSTFFQSITNSKLGNPANYPFATIEPSQAVTQLPNEKLFHLQDIYKAKKVVPSTLTVIDIAGLTKGASDGKGLGNKFLNDIKMVDGIFHLVRGFSGEEVTHLEGGVDPVRDMYLVQDELILKDLEYLERSIEQNSKKRIPHSNVEYKILQGETKLLEQLQEFLYNGQKISNFKTEWGEDEAKVLNKYNFLTSKPTLILFNVDPIDYLTGKHKSLKDMITWRDQYAPRDNIVLFSAEIETKYNEMVVHKGDREQFTNYCKQLAPGITEADSALSTIIQEMKCKLHLLNFYTCGDVEVKQWNIREGTTAREAAGVIHTDLQRTFINAEITHYADVDAHVVKRVGKDYVMQDDDIAFFKAVGGKTR
ncbi:Ylf2p KNAG_0C05600 [Huiozyma naganishii CBS 8797]|uniref:OBG-type G domain-containing protein n=1 Tax=Huiozyma naganishii (strain ATCC MYA-139 / BCRC 22969 / CBS 8797 / KCTC 17520 / NBRC 10181 / NCYC 3082 / Yp74L-3) TaxID=1071383 RepID=J7RJG2_HUIN7|nr:hypothetical protein KNAG_0C05600 [Kazachstania naganishii CBS 8797]CCK69658.1 hypothetical protein KNAG_0C05600 [Kazachstania naganishii CBS 8797]